MKTFASLILLSSFTLSAAYATDGDTLKTGSALKPGKYPDHAYIPENNRNKKVVSYPPLIEANVMWSKRVWRVIDLREKMNLPLYYPDQKTLGRKSMYDVIVDAALSGDGKGNIICFDNPATDDEFRYDMTKEELRKKLFKKHKEYIEQVDGTWDSVDVYDAITTDKVWKYWVKEDWFFDKERSVMEVRILGICPLIEKVSESGEHMGADVPLFWIYFPEARPVFATAEVFNRKNDTERRTLDDIFWKRMFSSYVRKESNVYDRGIFDYKIGLDAQLEAERVKNEIFTYEHDLWHF
ncbi:MAG: gliding motility protein GldN [Bacteroidia bacterium]